MIAYDGRNSSHVIEKVVSSALNFSGLDCSLGGLMPTPCLEFATKKLGYDGGIMITASHNPPEYNGIKVVASDGVEISRNDEKEIEKIFFEKDWNTLSHIGSTYNEKNTLDVYINGIKSHLDLSLIHI